MPSRIFRRWRSTAPSRRTRPESRATGGQIRGGDALAVANRPAVRGHRHRGGGKRDLGPGPRPARGRQTRSGQKRSNVGHQIDVELLHTDVERDLSILRGFDRYPTDRLPYQIIVFSANAAFQTQANQSCVIYLVGGGSRQIRAYPLKIDSTVC